MQVNGKLRGQIEVPNPPEKDVVLAAVDAQCRRCSSGSRERNRERGLRPGKLVNIVVKWMSESHGLTRVSPTAGRLLLLAPARPELASCGYGLVGNANILLAPTVHTIEVPAFVNRTTRVELEQRVTQAVADRVRLARTAEAGQLRAGARTSSCAAPSTRFGIFPVAFNQQGRATQYQISITAKIELLDHRADDKVLWKNDQYRFTENYQVNTESTRRLRPGDARHQRDRRAVRGVAGDESARRILSMRASRVVGD